MDYLGFYLVVADTSKKPVAFPGCGRHPGAIIRP